MAGSFTSGRYRFQVESRDWVSDLKFRFHEDLYADGFDHSLTRTGQVPDLGGSPIASWLLARLARLTDDRLGLGGRHASDGGGYMIEFVVYRTHPDWIVTPAPTAQPLLFDMAQFERSVDPETAVASFQFQASMEGAAVVGYRATDCDAEKVLQAFATALLAAPNDLLCRELEVSDPEWKLDPEMYHPRPVKGSRNWYGWDGVHFLGKDNIRDAD